MTTLTNTTVPEPPSPEHRSVKELVIEVAGKYVTALQGGYTKPDSVDPKAVALLAQLRRGAGKLPHEVPELWGITGTDQLFQERSLGEKEATRAETALFVAITLYALHQQSRSDRMHRRDANLGAAVRKLMLTNEVLDEPIRRRFVRVGTATTIDILAYRLREIISLLRRESIPLDYAGLAGDLYEAQRPGGLSRARQGWGRGFHSYRPRDQGNTLDPTTTITDGESTMGDDSE